MKIFLWFFDFELQNDQCCCKLNKDIWVDCAVPKEKALLLSRVIIWRQQSPNKRFTTRKCFVHPLVDYQLQVIFKTLDDSRWGPSLQKVQVKCPLTKAGNIFGSLGRVFAQKSVTNCTHIIMTSLHGGPRNTFTSLELYPSAWQLSVILIHIYYQKVCIYILYWIPTWWQR